MGSNEREAWKHRLQILCPTSMAQLNNRAPFARQWGTLIREQLNCMKKQFHWHSCDQVVMKTTNKVFRPVLLKLSSAYESHGELVEMQIWTQ